MHRRTEIMRAEKARKRDSTDSFARFEMPTEAIAAYAQAERDRECWRAFLVRL